MDSTKGSSELGSVAGSSVAGDSQINPVAGGSEVGFIAGDSLEGRLVACSQVGIQAVESASTFGASLLCVIVYIV